MRNHLLTQIRYVCLFIALVPAGLAQQSAAIFGTVLDPSKALVVGATVTLTDQGRGARHETVTNASASYVFDPIDPGEYTLVIQYKGFGDVRIERLAVKARDRLSLRHEMAIAGTSESVTVDDQLEGFSADSSVGVTMEQSVLEHLPVNGRTVQSLLTLAPGITAGGGPGGGIHSNGLRSNTNYYMLDGVSMGGEGGGGGGGPMGGGPGGPGGGMGGMGGGGGLGPVSLDSLQEVRVQTSVFAPEFGRTSGAQVSMTSKGGTNAYHGSAYEYFRNHHLNANDWFANEAGIGRGRMLQNQFGGTLGGAVLKNRTFFFVSGESAELRIPSTVVASVPDLASRAAAPAALRRYLRVFPLPNGPELDGGAARFSAVVTNPQSRQNYAGRVDHTLTAKDTLFVRYGYSPGSGGQRGSEFVSPNVWSNQEMSSHTVTGAWTRLIRPAVTNELRANYSGSSGSSTGGMDSFGGGVPLADPVVFPNGVDSTTGTFNLSILGLASYSLGARGSSEQKQINIVDGLSLTADTHTYKLGLDYRTNRSTNHNVPYSTMATFNGLASEEGSILSGSALMASVSSSRTEVYPSTANYSFYVQDTWRSDSRLTITYGVRWDINPAPTAWKGLRPFAIAAANSSRVTQADPLYDTRWADLSPRLGFAKQIGYVEGREWVVRGGFGIFHDPGYGTSMSAFSGAPYGNVRSLTSPAFPLAASDLIPPGLTMAKPYGQIGAAERSLQAPAIWQWNMTVEKSYGPAQVLSMGYAATRGSRLLRTETQPSYSDDYDVLRLATNGATSSYHSLQAQYRRRFARSLQTQVGYTWAHSIDSASSDMGMGGFATIFGGGERGNSDYDVRHSLTASGSWQAPSARAGWYSGLLRDWYTDFLFIARTGTPFDITGVSATTSATSAGSPGRGLFAQVRPDYNGLPVWIDDPTAPGGRRLNREAFESPTGYAQGNLGRNSLRGFGTTQLDLSLRRQVRLGERSRLNMSVQAFNLFNTPSFANPSRNEGASMTSANFGVASRSLAQGAGTVYQTGGPRSIQAVLRFQF